MKTCVSCKHFSETEGIEFSKCNSPNNGINPVSGVVNVRYADHARGSYGPCGPSGKYHEPIVYEQKLSLSSLISERMIQASHRFSCKVKEVFRA